MPTQTTLPLTDEARRTKADELLGQMSLGEIREIAKGGLVVALEVLSDIDATGGLTAEGAPAADEDWVDLGATAEKAEALVQQAGMPYTLERAAVLSEPNDDDL